MHENTHLKEELVAAISGLFLTYGLRSTSMDDIAAHLKVSKKTLYQIFENKDDVVEQVVFYRFEKRREENAPDELLRMSPVQFLYNIKRHILADLNTQLPANYFDVKKYHPEVYGVEIYGDYHGSRVEQRGCGRLFAERYGYEVADVSADQTVQLF